MQAGRSTPWRPGSHDICLVLVGRRWEYWKGEWSPQGWEQRVKGSRIKQGQKTCHTFPAHLTFPHTFPAAWAYMHTCRCNPLLQPILYRCNRNRTSNLEGFQPNSRDTGQLDGGGGRE